MNVTAMKMGWALPAPPAATAAAAAATALAATASASTASASTATVTASATRAATATAATATRTARLPGPGPRSARGALRLLPLSFALLMAGCAALSDLGPRDEAQSPRERAQPMLPAGVTASAAAGSSALATATPLATAPDAAPAAPAPDWRGFVQDPALRALVDAALEHNRDLRVAAANVARARSGVAAARAAHLPQLGVGLGAQRAPTANGEQGNVLTAGLQLASWEIDLFGRLDAGDAAARATLAGSEAGQRAAEIAVVAQVLASALAERSDARLVELTRQTLAAREEALRLVTLREKVGYSSLIELDAQKALVAQTRAALAQAQRQWAQDQQALALLIGRPLQAVAADPELRAGSAVRTSSDSASASWPGSGSGSSLSGSPGPSVASDAAAAAPSSPASATPKALPALPRSTALDDSLLGPIPEGLDSSALWFRPDVLQAEAALAAADANVRAARAALWPSLTLTGQAGQIAPTLAGLFRGGNFAYTLAANAALAVFDGGRRRAGIAGAQATQDAALAQYEKALQSAFREAADALVGVQTWREQAAALDEQARAAREVARLTDLKTRQGAASLLEQLEAQRQLYAAEQALLQARQAELSARVAVWKALGR